MPEIISRPKSEKAITTYAQLRTHVREALALGKERAIAAVEHEKVRTSWEVGKLILDHILLNQKRADYGRQVILRLSKDIGMSYTELKYCLEFARAYPIGPQAGQLSWHKYRDLLAINDPERRNALEKEAAQNNWNREEIRAQIKKITSKSSAVFEITSNTSRDADLLLKPGKPGICRIVQWNGKSYYDLGFSIYSEIKGKAPKQNEPPAEALYYYEAKLTEVYDGDTFHVLIDLGLGMVLEQRLRLRRINAPELMTAEGESARKNLQKILNADRGRLLIKTSKTDDQYGRYLVDVWVKSKSIEPGLLKTGIFTLRGDV